MISVTCGGCGKGFELPDHLAGKRGRCKACGAVLTVPEFVTADQVDGWLAEPVPTALDAIVVDDGPAPAPVAVASPPPLPSAPAAAAAVATNLPVDAEQLLARVRQLEASHRRQRLVATAAVILAALCGVSTLVLAAGGSTAGRSAPALQTEATAAPSSDEVTARRFVLRDDQGVARAAFYLTKTGQPQVMLQGREGSEIVLGFHDRDEDFPRLSITDKAGKQRVSLSVAPAGVALSLYDDAGEVSAKLSCGGSKTGPCVFLARRPTEAYAQLGLLANGQPFFDIVDAKENDLMRLPAAPSK